jgi:glutamate racemase
LSGSYRKLQFDAPVGVFDSGVGGLTVLAALRHEMPQASFVYLGDTARLPYGTKSPETVVRYALRAAEALVERGIGLLVVACNTASAVALPSLRQRFGDLPVIGVVEPGAEAACASSASGRIAVLATEGTVRGKAYERAILARRPDAQVISVACPVFVALAEEGWHDNAVARAAALAYVAPLFADPRHRPAPDCVVLGCTHFPLLSGVIAEICGPSVARVDSAQTTARSVARLGEWRAAAAPRVHCLATDGIERFARVGARFLGAALDPRDVELVDL